MTDNRRTAPRRAASLPAHIETDEGRSMAAVTQDLSASGLLVLSHRPLAVGQEVSLYLLYGGEQHELRGKVVREEPLAHQESAMWLAKAAIAIDTSDQELAAILDAIAAAP